MRTSFLSRTLAVVCLSLIGVIAVGCSCSDDEDDAEKSCETIAAAVNQAVATCGLPPISTSEICGVVCPGGFSYCSERTDVDACATAIASLPCGDFDVRMYARLDACVDIFDKMARSCGPSDSDADDFDFDD